MYTTKKKKNRQLSETYSAKYCPAPLTRLEDIVKKVCTMELKPIVGNSSICRLPTGSAPFGQEGPILRPSKFSNMEKGLPWSKEHADGESSRFQSEITKEMFFMPLSSR